jgi:hypothetical protein
MPARSNESRDALAREYRTSSLRQMAARRGVSWQAVQDKLKKRGIALRARGGDFRRFPSPEARAQ